jgi:hypothetical protein
MNRLSAASRGKPEGDRSRSDGLRAPQRVCATLSAIETLSEPYNLAQRGGLQQGRGSSLAEIIMTRTLEARSSTTAQTLRL